MRLLLDTHALLWWMAGDEHLSLRARHLIGDETNTVFVSAASAWEISTKVRLGKLPGAEFLASDLPDHLIRQGFQELEITVEHGQRAGSLPGPHRDPFDRMLIAQAQAENLTLITNEQIFDQFGVVRAW